MSNKTTKAQRQERAWVMLAAEHIRALGAETQRLKTIISKLKTGRQ